MDKEKEIQVTLAHEFWCCTREFNAFIQAALALLVSDSSKAARLEAFTAYGNFVRLLYSFYEGIIECRNAELLSGVKEKGHKISQEIVNEVKKMIRNQVAVYRSRKDLDMRELQHLVESEVPDCFGDDFRKMRNRFSHPSIARVNVNDLTLFEFFNRYHKYLLLLYRHCAFSWHIPNPDAYDWAEIDNFFSHLSGSANC